MNINVLTTLFHLLALTSNIRYNIVIISAVCASVLHHLDEKNKIIHQLDHCIAVLWAATDAYHLPYTAWLNIASLIASRLMHNYHAEWHLINTVKSVIVSCLLTNQLATQ